MDCLQPFSHSESADALSTVQGVVPDVNLQRNETHIAANNSVEIDTLSLLLSVIVQGSCFKWARFT